MLKFKNVNVNPKNRKTGDCSTRAIAYALNIPWEEALRLQYEEAIKTKYDPTSRQIMERVLGKFGYEKIRQPRKEDNTKYLIKELDEALGPSTLKNRIVCNVANHYVVVEGDHYVDTWDSGFKCCGNCYIKVR